MNPGKQSHVEVEDLRDEIEKLRFKNTNVEGRNFVSGIALVELLHEDRVRLCLRSLNIPLHHQQELAKTIAQGAQRCFAILLLIDRGQLISSFYSHDALQTSSPDDRLPYNGTTLGNILGLSPEDLTVHRFMEKQWDFAIPRFSKTTLPRKLEAKVILPYIDETPLGKGAFGEVWSTRVHDQCHQLPLDKHMFVRKEIKKSIEVDQDTFVRELRNLSLLAHISHPNLIELFCAYEYRGNFNFIFAMAEGGTLSDLLLGKTQIPVFAGSVGTMLFALADLASAIQVLHNFTVRVLDLQLSGCHHDLAPRNILIRGKTFLLADFGLSSFRSVDETSLTSFKEVGGSYVAPECQKLQEGRLQTQKITKASDIWSFGCIITEAFTYSILGADGVRRFREQRKHEVTEDITWYRFFRGIDAPSPEVKRWIQSLSSTADPSLKLTVELVENMLSMDPQARPGAVEVLERLRCVALLSSAKTVHVRYDLAVRESPQFDLQLEEIRFRSWIIVFEGIARTASGPIQPPRENTQFEYDILTQTFQQTELYLSDLVTGSSDANTRTIFLLQEQNTKLINAISDTFQRQVNTHVEQMILEEVNIDVSRCEHLTSEGISNSNIGTLISVKHMLSLERKGLLSEHQDILLQQDEIKIKEEIDHHSLATFRSNGQSILVEWLRYSTPWVDEVTGRQLRDRVGSIARLLHAADESRLPGTLRCYGFFPQASRKGFGFVYELKSEKATSPRPITLNQLYDPNHKSLKPSLESRVELACKITQALYKLHSVSWLHRNLHPSNVIFLMDNDTRMGKFVRNPYLLGFTASRQNVADAATIGPSAILDYHHPEYLEDKKQRYREEFDYYSVGILLLEIGHWNSLPRITSSGKFSGLKPELFRKEILKTMVSPIARTMGSKYEQVVRVCLESRFNDAHFHFHETAHMSVLEDFKRKVVDLLQEILDGLTVKS